ncbi:DUF3148 domain-containing protein [Cyanobium sp. ATX 6F1]|nr:DUF3148 domain-containing protein [Cyanobium sp. ATX 6F1]
MTFTVGDQVQLVVVPAYLKSADPMPMLRPADLIDREEVGEVVGVRAKGLLAVRFRRGAFLLETAQLVAVPSPSAPATN